MLITEHTNFLNNNLVNAKRSWRAHLCKFKPLLLMLAFWMCADASYASSDQGFIELRTGKLYASSSARYDYSISKNVYISSRLNLAQSNMGVRYRNCNALEFMCLNASTYYGDNSVSDDTSTSSDKSYAMGIGFDKHLNEEWAVELEVQYLTFTEASRNEPNADKQAQLSIDIKRRY